MLSRGPLPMLSSGAASAHYLLDARVAAGRARAGLQLLGIDKRVVIIHAETLQADWTRGWASRRCFCMCSRATLCAECFTGFYC